MSKVDERRRNDRVPFSSALEVRRVDSGHRTHAAARDLSVSGMCFSTPLPLAIGEEVRIVLPNIADQNAIAARVRHVDEEGSFFVVGVEHARPA